MHVSASPAFEPQELAVMSEAFELSYQHLVSEQDRRLNGRHAHYIRETIAKLILGMARDGTQTPQALSAAVIEQMDVMKGA